MTRSRSILAALVAALLLLFAGACGDDDDTAAETTTTVEESSTTEAETTTTTPPEVEPITILVTNDDGIGSEGIDVLIEALTELDGVEVELVAPAENQSGSSDSTTEGEVAYDDGATVGGFEGTAVQGFPADAVNVALQELDIDADLVVSGINDGQNIGAVAAISGTVGAARTAARQGVPAVAVSAGFGELADYEAGAEYVIEWIEENRGAIVDGSLTTDTIVSFNVPSCTAGEPRDLLEVELGGALPEGSPFLEGVDCTIEPPAESPTDDVTALFDGYATETTVPLDL